MESEELHKNIISEFLKNTYCSPDRFNNIKGRADLVIHTVKDTIPVGVLFETKKPGTWSEMPAINNLTSKAFYELIGYYNFGYSCKHLLLNQIYWHLYEFK